LAALDDLGCLALALHPLATDDVGQFGRFGVAQFGERHLTLGASGGVVEDRL
jgi:hypothetical protein